MTYYIANTNFETMDTTEDGRILFNPANGDVHMLDFVGNTIYTMLEKSYTFEDLVEELSQMFDEKKEIIARDVKMYLDDAVAKDIITTHED